MKLQKIFLTGILILSAATLSAQPKEHTENVFKPHWYIQAQGGAQYTLGEVDFGDLVSPNVQLNVGWQFDKVVGARLSFNGWQSKGGSEFPTYDAKYSWKWNYVSPGIDFTFNLSNLFAGYNPKRVCSVGAFVGAGANIAWKNDEANDLNPQMAATVFNDPQHQMLENLWDGTKTRAYGRLGLNVDFRLCDAVSLGLEVQANAINDKYNSKKANNWDWYFNALAGVRVNLGKTHTTKTVTCPEPPAKVIERVVEKCNCKHEPAPAPVVAPAPAPVEKESIRRDVFFTINSTKVVEAESVKVKEIAEFLQRHPESKVTVTGVADKGTGTNAINERLASQRANVVSKTLQEQYGIDASRIKVESNGDRIQPFAQNDLNRVTICVAE